MLPCELSAMPSALCSTWVQDKLCPQKFRLPIALLSMKGSKLPFAHQVLMAVLCACLDMMNSIVNSTRETANKTFLSLV